MSLLSLALCGCGALRTVTGRGGHLEVAATVDPQANQNAALAVDLVTVEDKKTLAEVVKYSAHDWFMKRKDYVRLHPGQLREVYKEWQPGQAVPMIRLEKTGGAAGIVLFADYSSPGSHSELLRPGSTVRVDFGAQDFHVVPPRP